MAYSISRQDSRHRGERVNHAVLQIYRSILEDNDLREDYTVSAYMALDPANVKVIEEK